MTSLPSRSSPPGPDSRKLWLLDRPDPLLERTGLQPLVVGYHRRSSGPPYDTGRRTWPFWSMTFLVSGRLTARGAGHGLRNIGPGQVYLQFPNLWHQYVNDGTEPNEQYWIHFKGFIPEKYRDSGLFNPQKPVLSPESFDSMKTVLRKCVDRPADDPSTGRLLAVDLYHLLTGLLAAPSMGEPPTDPCVAAFQNLKRDMERGLGAPRFPWRRALAGLRLGEAQVRRRFKAWAGESPDQAFASIKLSAAKNRLARTLDPIHAIARDLGYHDVYHFSNRFKAAVGLSPKAYRQMVTEPSA